MTASLLRSRSAVSKAVAVIKRATQPARYRTSRAALKRETSNIRDLVAERCPKKRTRVTFNSTVIVRHIRNNSGSTDLGNPNETWYAGADYTAFRLESAVTLKFIHRAFSQSKNGNLTNKQRLDPTKFTARGLEDVLTPVIKERWQSQKLRHRRCVLMEHYIQRSEGTLDLDTLASVSEIMSSQSRRIAHHRGQSMKEY